MVLLTTGHVIPIDHSTFHETGAALQMAEREYESRISLFKNFADVALDRMAIGRKFLLYELANIKFYPELPVITKISVRLEDILVFDL